MKFKDIKKYGDLTNETYHNSIDLENGMINSLEGSPKEVLGYFNCSGNFLKSLEHSPKIINGFFNCSFNNLFSLENSPQKITGVFYRFNNSLNSLYGSPEEIKESFYCNNNDLISLEYCTKNIGKTLSFEGNPKLKNVREQIIKYQIKAENYFSDEENFSFEDIKEEFEKYGRYLLKKEQKEILKQKTKENIKLNKKILNKNDYGLSI